MKDSEKIRIVTAILRGAFELDMIGNTDETAVGYVQGMLDTVFEILCETEQEGGK